MKKLKRKIINTLREGTVTSKELEDATRKLVDVAKSELDLKDDKTAKEYVAGFIGEESIGEVNQEVMNSMIKQYGSKEAAEKVYYATANKQDRNPEDFHTENDDAVGRGIEAGMNPEVEADKYAEYRALMAQLAAEEGGEQPVKEEGVLSEYGNSAKYDLRDGNNIEEMLDGIVSILTKYMGTNSTNSAAVGNDNRVLIYDLIESGKLKQTIERRLSPMNMHHGASGREYWSNNKEAMTKHLNKYGINDFVLKGDADRNPQQEQVREEESTNNPVKLKQDVAKLMAKLDMSFIKPYLKRIDNAVEQAEVIGQFAEMIGVPKAKLSMVVSQLRSVAEAKMTKNKLIESVTGRKIVKTIKVKDVK
jgi:hypothetical protein